jgi:WD40 repeat protein
VSNRFLRLYDLRAPQVSAMALSTSAPRQATSKAIVEVVRDPLDSHRLATYGDDSVIRIWDCRALTTPALTFSYKDAVGDGADSRTTPSLTGIEFSPMQRGMLATLEADRNVVRFWDVLQAKQAAEPDISPNPSETAYSKRSTGWKWSLNDRDSQGRPGNPAEEQRASVHLTGTHRCTRFEKCDKP